MKDVTDQVIKYKHQGELANSTIDTLHKQIRQLESDKLDLRTQMTDKQSEYQKNIATIRQEYEEKANVLMAGLQQLTSETQKTQKDGQDQV